MILRTNIKYFLFCIALFGMSYSNFLLADERLDIIFVVDAVNNTERKILLRKNDERLITSTRETLKKLSVTHVSISISDINSIDKEKPFNSRKQIPSLIIPVGTKATQFVSNLRVAIPTLAILVPRLSFEEIYKQAADLSIQERNISVIFLDQPLERRLNLAHLILPGARRVGIVFGPSTAKYENEFRDIARHKKFDLQIAKVITEDHLISSLDKLLAKSDFMLGVVDPLVFNRTSARNILLTAYRRRTPLIGISPSYVRAGALASVYTTPSQFGVQLAETIRQFDKYETTALSKTQYPKYFSVAINFQVADSMAVQVYDEEKLKYRLSELEESSND